MNKEELIEYLIRQRTASNMDGRRQDADMFQSVIDFLLPTPGSPDVEGFIDAVTDVIAESGRTDRHKIIELMQQAMRQHFPQSPAVAEGEQWFEAAEAKPVKAGQYQVVYKGPHKEVVAESYYCNGDGWDRYKSNNYHVIKWRLLPAPPKP